MSAGRDQRGFTLIELIVSMGLSLVVIGSVVTLLTVFLNDSRYDGLRDQAQTDSKVLVDRMSRELRSAASPSAGSSGLLQEAAPYDILFQTVNPTGTPPSGNAANQQWVRYCLDGNETLWRQTDSSISSTPDTTNCPSTSNAWAQKSNGNPCCVELTDVTNEIGTNPTILFKYGPTGYSGTSQIREVQVDIITDLNPGHLPGPSPQLVSGVYLRNENSAPVIPDFTVTSSGTGSSTRNVTLDGTQAYDPNGQTMQYQWYASSGSSGTCASSSSGPSSGALSGGSAQTFSGTSANGTTFTSGSSWTFALVVTDTQGLTTCASKLVTIS